MNRTVLIGVDGATFDVLDPFVEAGLMPNLGALMARGARAPLRTILPALTPPAWTSLMTGKRPGRHGVFDFFQKEAPDSEFFRLSTSQDIRTPTIWAVASEHGRRVISLNFPLMFPAPKVNGAVVPGGWMPWRQLRLGCHPAGLFDRLKTLPSFNPRELALDMELEAKAIEGCPEDEYVEWIQLHTRREERWLEILRFLVTEDEPSHLIAVMFDGVDKLQHLCWRFIDPASRPEHPSPWERQMIELCERYFRRLDEMIGEIVALGGPDATVVVASDHGFGPTWDMFYVNRWLEEQGYLAWAAPDAAPPADDALKVGFATMTRHITELDWERTVAYAATPSSQGINIVRSAPGTNLGVPAAQRAGLRDALAAALRNVRNPYTGRPLVVDVVTQEEGFAGPYQDLAPDLSLVLEDGAAVSITRSEAAVRRREFVNGNHRHHGVFVAAGPAVQAGRHLPELSITDVAPLVLYGVDVPIPDDLDGRLPEEILDPAELRRRPPRYASVAGDETIATSGERIDLDSDDEAVLLGRLRALGYVE